MIKLDISGTKATLQRGRWTCTHKVIERYLNSLIDPLGPSGADPYPELTIAKEAARRLRGTIISLDSQPIFRLDVVY